MTATVEQIRALRERTAVGMATCKKALEATDGDVEKAIEHLRVLGELKAKDVINRAANEGAVISYVHPGNQVGVLLQVGCESDFVARGDDFMSFCRDVAMHIAASKPLYVSVGAVDSHFQLRERELIYQQMAADPKLAKKPEAMLVKIADGKLEKALREVCLLDQPFVKDPTKTIEQLRQELVQKTGENVRVERFSRFDLREVRK